MNTQLIYRLWNNFFFNFILLENSLCLEWSDDSIKRMSYVPVQLHNTT